MQAYRTQQDFLERQSPSSVHVNLGTIMSVSISKTAGPYMSLIEYLTIPTETNKERNYFDLCTQIDNILLSYELRFLARKEPDNLLTQKAIDFQGFATIRRSRRKFQFRTGRCQGIFKSRSSREPTPAQRVYIYSTRRMSTRAK